MQIFGVRLQLSAKIGYLKNSHIQYEHFLLKPIQGYPLQLNFQFPNVILFPITWLHASLLLIFRILHISISKSHAFCLLFFLWNIGKILVEFHERMRAYRSWRKCWKFIMYGLRIRTLYLFPGGFCRLHDILKTSPPYFHSVSVSFYCFL